MVLPAPLDIAVVRLAIAAVLGLFLGLEREWSHTSAGIGTFSLVSFLGAVFTVVGCESLLVVSGLVAASLHF